MSLNANFETCLVWGVAHTTVLKVLATPRGMQMCFLLNPRPSTKICFFLVTFYEPQEELWSIVVLQIKAKLNETCSCLLLKHTCMNLNAKCVCVMEGGGQGDEDLTSWLHGCFSSFWKRAYDYCQQLTWESNTTKACLIWITYAQVTRVLRVSL